MLTQGLKILDDLTSIAPGGVLLPHENRERKSTEVSSSLLFKKIYPPPLAPTADSRKSLYPPVLAKAVRDIGHLCEKAPVREAKGKVSLKQNFGKLLISQFRPVVRSQSCKPEFRQRSCETCSHSISSWKIPRRLARGCVSCDAGANAAPTRHLSRQCVQRQTAWNPVREL